MSLSSSKCPVGRVVCRPRAALALVLVLSGVGAGTAAANHNQPYRHPVEDASGALVDVEVAVGRRTAPLYQAPGRYDRLYFEALRGRNYSLRVHNKTGQRVGVLIAVDGLNVIDGERSGLSKNEAMYVLDPWEEAEIRGWRTSLREVRKFVFVDEERSYAERSGKANGDMGWIRVLAFREEGSRWFSERDGRFRDRNQGSRGAEPYGAEQDAEGAPPPSPGSATPESQLKTEGHRHGRDESNPGTGWGDETRDPVNRTWFVAEHRPTDRFNLRYEYASGLRALGIDVRRHRNRLWEREQGDFGFAQPPRW